MQNTAFRLRNYLAPAHRIARVNYFSENGVVWHTSFLDRMHAHGRARHGRAHHVPGVLTLLAYPHWPYLHARIGSTPSAPSSGT